MSSSSIRKTRNRTRQEKQKLQEENGGYDAGGSGIENELLRKATEMLLASTVPEDLPGREAESMEIEAHIQAALEDRKGCCICVPGTGKTATIKHVIETLQTQFEFTNVYINGMSLVDPAFAYVQLWHAISGTQRKLAPSSAEQQLEAHFRSQSKRKITPVVCVLDELDSMLNKKQSVIYNFFNWPLLKHSNLVIIAIANTMDLPERALTNKVTSRLGLARVNFYPYNFEQLQEIVESRLDDTPIFHKNALILCSRKIAAVSGDARRALDICRRAVELYSKSGSTDHLVAIKFVNDAIDEMFQSKDVSFVLNCSLQQKIFLICLLSVFKQTGISEAEIGKVAQHHVKFCKSHGISCPPVAIVLKLPSQLADSGILRCQSSLKPDIYQKVGLHILENDIIYGLRNDALVKDLFDKIGITTF